jgi:hypothetical protein
MSKMSRMILVAALAVFMGQRFASADDQLPPPTTGVATNEPAKPKPATKPKAASAKAKKTAQPMEPALPLTPGPAVVRQANVNVRGKAAINSEVVGKLQKNDHVTVIEEVTLKKPKTDEPARWAKIALPTNSTVWVHSDYIDANSKTVKPKRLNLRSGPGENYSVVGHLEKGAKIQEIEAKDQWIKIEPPAGTYAFVAAHLLRPEIADSAVASASTPPAKPLETAQVDTPPAPAKATEPEKPVTEAPAPAATGTPTPTPTPTQSEIVLEEEPKRVVTREGVVRRSVSIQAPTYFVLESADTGRAINYLFSTNVALKDFRGHRIQVTGEELLDERWPNTPVIAVEKLEAVP